MSAAAGSGAAGGSGAAVVNMADIAAVTNPWFRFKPTPQSFNTASFESYFLQSPTRTQGTHRLAVVFQVRGTANNTVFESDYRISGVSLGEILKAESVANGVFLLSGSALWYHPAGGPLSLEVLVRKTGGSGDAEGLSCGFTMDKVSDADVTGVVP